MEECNEDLMEMFRIIILITKKPENDFISIEKGIPFNGFVKISPCV